MYVCMYVHVCLCVCTVSMYVYMVGNYACMMYVFMSVIDDKTHLIVIHSLIVSLSEYDYHKVNWDLLRWDLCCLRSRYHLNTGKSGEKCTDASVMYTPWCMLKEGSTVS